MNITDFLLARIAEDEKVARKAAHQKIAGPFHGNWHANSLRLAVLESEDAAHVARHDPARVLAECAAKRAIVDLHRIGNDPCDAHDAEYKSIPCETIESLAAVYRDHPDYQQEWE